MPWASYQIRKIAGCACARNAGNVSPHCRFQRKPLVSDPGMHHGTCVTHVPWCMSGSLTCGDGENVPGIPGACAPAILRIWQEAHYEQYWTAVMVLVKGLSPVTRNLCCQSARGNRSGAVRYFPEAVRPRGNTAAPDRFPNDSHLFMF